jgi:RHS repeat-associated protein
MAVISDKKVGIDSDNNGSVDFYAAELQSAQDYYPFGMPMPGRNFNAGDYRYGFNGKENDPEVEGQQDYGFRIYDTRLARFKSVDPLTKDYPWYTPYQFAGNSPIWAIDLDGLEEYHSQYLMWNEVGKVKQALVDAKDVMVGAYDKVAGAIGNGLSRVLNSDWEGNSRPTFGFRFWADSGPTVENNKDVPMPYSKVRNMDKAVLDALATRNSANMIKTKSDNSSGDGRGSGNEGGTDWSKPSDEMKTTYEGAQKLYNNDAYKMSEEYNQKNMGQQQSTYTRISGKREMYEQEPAPDTLVERKPNGEIIKTVEKK